MNEQQTPQLPEGAAEALEQAHAAHLAGKPGELQFAIEIKRKDGSVEHHTLIGRIDGVSS